MKKVVLGISVLLLVASIGLFVYLYNKNNEINKEITEFKNNVESVEKAIDDDKKEIDEKEDEYEKLKEKVKVNMEELEIWESIKEKLQSALA